MPLRNSSRAVAVGLAAVVALAGVIELGNVPRVEYSHLPSLGEAPASSPAPPVESVPSGSPMSERESEILDEAHRLGAPAPDLHLPDLSVPEPYRGERVSPTYHEAPAPMGVADLGLANVSGNLVGSVLDTSSVEGTISLTEALSANVDGDGPDMFGVQLDAVDTGVTLFGHSTDEFWTQNFVDYTPSSGELVFGDNVWNFSNFAAYLSPNAFFATGPNGSLHAPVYYYATGPTFTIHYPFTLTLYENSTVLFDRPAVFFNYTLSNSTMRTSASFDYVVFNATAGTPRAAYPAGVYEINGEHVDPVGLPNDLELDVVGNDDGDTTSFYAMEATLAIATWSSSSGTYVSVPSAMDAGSESGETSDGVSVSYSGSTPVASIQLGPSFVYGLWGESSNSGAQSVVQTLHPASIFLFVNPGATQNDSSAQWVPSSPTGTTTFFVPNGEYWMEYLLADHTPGGLLLDAADNSTTSTTFTGGVNLGLGVYTPLIAFGNGELASLSSGGTGAAARPFTLYNNQYGTIDPQFAALNDFQFPVFPGLLLVGTTDHVSVTPPSFEIDYPSWMLPRLAAFGLPSTNDLQLQFWEARNVTVVGGTVSGWLSASLVGFPEGSVMFWDSSNNLVDGTTFLDQGDSIVLYGGTTNTLWGSLFLPSVVGATDSSDVLNLGAFTQGVNESESGDLIYNNYFDVPLPAITPTFDPLSCQIRCERAAYTDAWNVSFESASVVETVQGEPLTGSIIGTWYQGGNFWLNYGEPSNPYGVLPYNDTNAIAYGGDRFPLVPFTLYPVTFIEAGLPPGSVWGVSVVVTTLSREPILNESVPNGTYHYSVVSPSGYTTAEAGNFTVSGAMSEVHVAFARAFNLTFVESDLPASLDWSVELHGSELGGVAENDSAPPGAAIVFAASAGPYFFNATAPGYSAVPGSGHLVIAGRSVQLNVTFVSSTALTFSEFGLPGNQAWTVSVTQGGSTTTLASFTAEILLPGVIATPGSYNFSAASPGFVATPETGTGSLPANATQNITFTVATGVLSGRITPATAALWIGAALTPLRSNGSFSLAVAIGVHSIEVAESGYLTYFNNLTVNVGHTTSFAVNLTAMSTAAGISRAGWLLIGFLALLAAIFLVMSVIFAGRRREPPAGFEPHNSPVTTARPAPNPTPILNRTAPPVSSSPSPGSPARPPTDVTTDQPPVPGVSTEERSDTPTSEQSEESTAEDASSPWSDDPTPESLPVGPRAPGSSP